MPDRHDDEATRLRDDGFAHLEAGRLREAEAALLAARELDPADPLVHFRLALVYVDTGRPAEAVAALDASLRLDPDNARAHNNRGSALQLVGRAADAERAFRRALELDPDLVQPYTNLGYLLERQGRPQDAVALYGQAIARGVDPPLFAHHVAAASGRTTARAPEQWVRATFDNFAPTFDTRLRALGYDAPRRLAALLAGRLGSGADILDLGCGTGLCGAALAARKRRLTGVDLSERMLVQARQRGVYDELHAAEIESWLRGADAGAYDVVVAADVFIYIGALEGVFREVARVLRAGGWFAFSTEECAAGDYALQPSGRYAQSLAYVGRLAGESFAVAVAEPAVIRTEAGTPLAGRLVLLQRR